MIFKKFQSIIDNANIDDAKVCQHRLSLERGTDWLGSDGVRGTDEHTIPFAGRFNLKPPIQMLQIDLWTIVGCLVSSF